MVDGRLGGGVGRLEVKMGSGIIAARSKWVATVLGTLPRGRVSLCSADDGHDQLVEPS